MRKPILFLLGLLFFLTCACNLPMRSLSGASNGTKTPASQITVPPQQKTLEPLASETPQPERPTSIPQTPSLMPVPTAGLPLAYDPTLDTVYLTQSGDTLSAVAAHFGVSQAEILSARPLPQQGLLPVNQTLAIPKLTEPAPYTQKLLPDSEIVNSPCGHKFNISDYVNTAGGLLSTYTQEVDSHLLTGAEIVKLVSENASINPRFLLAFIEYRSHWVSGSPANPDLSHPLGFNIPNNEGLYHELTTSANLLNIGYYAWRAGQMTSLIFLDGRSIRISPALNAGSVALQYLFARMFVQSDWQAALYGSNGYLSTYRSMFGDPMACARTVEPLFPDGLQVPALELPFTPGETWALTGGLHADWIVGTPPGALDFAPVTGEPPCAVSRVWVLASAAGVVTRSTKGILQLALVDETGKPTGWELVYIHIAEQGRVSTETHVKTNDPIGHPSCEGGEATGTHVHIARMYQGEWIGGGDPFPYTLSGWLAVSGGKPYQSTLVKGERVVTSNINGSTNSWIVR